MPSAFVSSRSNKRNNDSKGHEQRPEDFMDEEDLADAAEAQALQTAGSYSGFGSTEGDDKRKGLLMDILKSDNDTIGFRLLRKMGWRDGQGLGAKIRRGMRTDDGAPGQEKGENDHQFAPDDTTMITITRKDDRKGLGYKLQNSGLAIPNSNITTDFSDDDSPDSFHVNSRTSKIIGKPTNRSGMGIGVLSDYGSGDEDPYTMGPRISYNRVIGGDKKKKDKLKSTAFQIVPLKSSNPLLVAKPVFISKKASIAKPSFRNCHDGRLPITGFILSNKPDSTLAGWELRYPLPKVPEHWESKHSTVAVQPNGAQQPSTADAARSSQLDAKARARILGEQLLPGQSVFDFISPGARDKLAAASGKSSLPAGRGEVTPKEYAAAVQRNTSSNDFPCLNKDIAIAALGRGLGGWMPYADDEPKRARYRDFLEFAAEIRAQPPSRPSELKRDDWDRELREFAHAAEVFKPMTGKMATRFTTSSVPVASLDVTVPEMPPLLSTRTAKPEDPAEAAAKMDMFGPLTRSTQPFYPTRLLCKRFNVKLPSNVQPDADGGQEARSSGNTKPGQPADLLSKVTMGRILDENPQLGRNLSLQRDANASLTVPALQDKVEIDLSKNDALEAAKAGDAVFKAIFGDDDSDG